MVRPDGLLPHTPYADGDPQRQFRRNVPSSGPFALNPAELQFVLDAIPVISHERAEREGYSVTLLPTGLQQAIKAYLTYRYQEQRVALKTLMHDLTVIVHFLAWAREHTTLATIEKMCR